VERVYKVRVAGVPGQRALDRLARGIVLDGRRTAPAEVRLVHGDRDTSAKSAVLLITLREGRNRQVRRMCEAVGHPVEQLTRIRIGPITDGGLKPGQSRDLTADEVRALRKAVGT
jgi:23S rRNA pseudouridine2605 synthase